MPTSFAAQEQGRLAKFKNASSRSQLISSTTDNADEGANSDLVAHCPSIAKVDDLCGLADEHYAISEEFLEAERAKSSGWMRAGHLKFEQEHGVVGQDPGLDESSDESDDDCCSIDLCRKQASELEHYQFWFDQFISVLRLARLTRKAKGYVADHPLLVMLNSQLPCNMECLLPGMVCFLLPKVQFRPYDATVLKMTISVEEETYLAKMHRGAHGLPDLCSLPQLLKEFCAEFKPSHYHLGMLGYEGKSFGTLHIHSVETMEQVAGRVCQSHNVETLSESDDDGEADKAMKKRADLLKKVFQAGQPTSKGKAKKTATKKVNAKVKQRPKKTTNQKLETTEGAPHLPPAEDPEEPGAAGQNHRAIENAWLQAMEEDMPAAPLPAGAPSACSSSQSSKPAEAAKPDPSNIPKNAWMDKGGYVFFPKEGNLRGVHLGPRPSCFLFLSIRFCFQFGLFAWKKTVAAYSRNSKLLTGGLQLQIHGTVTALTPT